MRKTVFIIAGVLLVAYAATGLYVVEADQVAIVRRFGRLVTELQDGRQVPAVRRSGLHLDLPWGMSEVTRLRLGETRQVEVGTEVVRAYRLAGTVRRDDEFLTGDLNIIHMSATAHYRVRDPVPFLLETAEGDAVVRQALGSALSEVVSRLGVDTVMTGGRAIEQQVQRRVQELADGYHLGVVVTAVNLGQVRPPQEVAAAFQDVAAARSDAARAIQQAEANRERLVRTAQSEASATRNAAVAARDAMLLAARGESQQFLAVLGELEHFQQQDPESYEQARYLTALRLYIDGMSDILPRLRSQVLVDSGEGVDIGILRDEGR